MQQQHIDGVGEHDSVNGGIRVVFTDRAVQNAAQLGLTVALSTGPCRTNQTTIMYALPGARATTILVALDPMSRIIHRERNVLAD